MICILLFSDIHLLKSSMGDKPKKPLMEQITDKMEDLEVGQEQSTIFSDSKKLNNSFIESCR